MRDHLVLVKPPKSANFDTAGEIFRKHTLKPHQPSPPAPLPTLGEGSGLPQNKGFTNSPAVYTLGDFQGMQSHENLVPPKRGIARLGG